MVGGGNTSVASGSSISTSSSTVIISQNEQELDAAQKMSLNHYVKRELFEKGYPIINEETYEEDRTILSGAVISAGVNPAEFLMYKSSIKKVVKEKLNNLRSYVKKEAKKLFKGT